MKKYIVILLSILGILDFSDVKASVEPELIAQLTGSANLVNNATLMVFDDVFLTSTGSNAGPNPSQSSYHLKRTLNTVTLKINQSTIDDCQIISFSESIDVQIEGFDANGGGLTTLYKTLTINYDHTSGITYKEKHSFTFEDAFWTKVTITSTPNSAYADYLILETTTSIERYLDIDLNGTIVFNTGVVNNKPNSILVSWPSFLGAEEYDLEWTWIDDYAINGSTTSASNIDYSFIDNATRVTITDNSYQIPTVFERGYLICRVRAVGKTGYFFDHRVPGKWSSDAYGPKISNSSGTSFTSNKDVFYLAEVTSGGGGTAPFEHEQVFTWQYSVTFAEFGKRKEVISYFDGSLRNRQMVTKVNTDESAIVGEQIYDHQGRPAVNILPVPDLEDPSLNYHPDFNLAFGSGEPYSRSDFDWGTNLCDRQIDYLSQNAGAEKYYSQDNSLVNDMHNEYIPNAFGYPFTITEFMPDNTGRIRRQSGVGQEHQLGSDHETKYYYAVPNQPELDRLFGNNVGFAAHYEKNMVIDPNGQVSISYLNSSGKVIATGLAGENPNNVEALSNKTSQVTQTVDLLEAGNTWENPNETFIYQTFEVSSQGNYTFEYEFNIPRHDDIALPTLCFDCVYDLEISLVNDCGEEQFDGNGSLSGNQPIIRTIGKPGSDFDVNCESGGLTYSFENDSELGSQNITINLPIGTYSLSKKLKINSEALSYYTEQFLSSSTTLKTEQDFKEYYISLIDDSDCEQTCSSCLSKLGSLSGFRNAQLSQLIEAEIIPDESDSAQIENAYNQQKLHCDLLCNQSDYSCDAYYKMLLSDVTPGGQYAEYTLDETNPANDDFNDVLAPINSIGFNYQYQWLNGTAYPLEYLDIDNQPIYINIDEELIEPNKLSAREFIRYFKPEWAEFLVQYHPEYCKYQFCVLNEGSEQYTNNMLLTETYEAALDSGFLNPTNYSSISDFSQGRGDPFWVESGSSKLSDIRTKMNSFINFDPMDNNCDDLSIWQVPISYLLCPGLNDCNTLMTCINGKSWSSTTCKPYLDQMWHMYRALYLQEKFILKESLSSYNCERSSHMYGKIPRFQGTQFALDLVTNITSIEDIKEQLTDSINLHCDQVCESQAEFWMKKLKPCGLSVNDSLAMRQDLIKVCKNGCDQHTPLGTTTVPAGKTKRISSPYNSFEDVFNAYKNQNKLSYQAGSCDVNSINFPKDQYHNYTEFVQDTGCIVFADQQDNCARAETNQALKSRFMQSIQKNDTLSCKKCIGCDQLYEAIDYLQDQYDNNFIDSNFAFRQIAEQILNSYLNFNLTYDDYVHFSLQCRDADTNGFYLAPLQYFFDTYNYSSTFINDLNLINPLNNTSLYALTGGKTDLWQSPGQEKLKTKPELLLASIEGYSTLGSSPPPSNVFLSSCLCNKLKEKFDTWITNNPGQDPNNPDTALFNEDLSNECWEVSSYGSFDYFTMLKYCKEAYSYSPNSGTLSSLSTWSSIQQNILNAIVKSKPLVIPNCFGCSGPPPVEKKETFYTKVSPDVGRASYPVQLSKHFTPCDSLQHLIDSIASLPGNENLKFNLTMYLYTNDSQYYDEPKYNILKDLFYTKFPHTYKDTSLTTNKEQIRAFFSRYKKCMIWDNIPLSGCCMEPSKEARKMLDMFNKMTQVKGYLGNHFMYSDWEAYSWLDEYYESILYNQPCSTSVTYAIDDFDMPYIKVSFKDTCGDTSNIMLSYTDNLYNQAYFGLITRFYDLQPVSNYNCDTNVHAFNVKIDQLDWDGNLITTTLTGYAPKWVLMDTCESEGPKLCDKSFFQSIPYKSRCRERLEVHAEYLAHKAYTEYMDSVEHDFKTKYLLKCSESLQNETFIMTRPQQEYHYTLYYYDQAGNLVKTVPPAGVDLITNSTTLTQIRNHRNTNSGSPELPIHSLGSVYYFNSLNQLTKQTTPDAGTSEFWYDNLGRLVVSRNAKQNNASGNDDYSYTQYDFLGRITEVGQLNTSTQMTWNIAFDPGDLSTFLSSGSKTEVTKTYYDILKYSLSYNDFTQVNLRSRVVSTTYEDSHDGNDNTYDHGVHYNYDMHGNVSELLRENEELNSIGENLKHISYRYDLVSGNVNEVRYQLNQPDQFLHRYNYDADNRIISVFTSTNNLHWDEDADYFYYLHGPLSRTEIGELKVQGIDYAYTLHGWIKTVNSNTLKANRDIGRDGHSSGVNQLVAQDVFGYSLSYYSNDYSSIGYVSGGITTSTNSIAGLGGDVGTEPELFNGNIRHMVTAIKPFLGINGEPQAMCYRYDQLNRIVEAKAFNDMDVSANEWQGIASSQYEESYSYDPNGNILSLNRKGDNPSNYDMDELDYFYNLGTNQLNYVSDGVSNANYSIDIDNQNANNYEYDEIGNLIKDVSEGITQIEWTVYGKIKQITKDNTANIKNTIYFEYSPDGHRVSKKVEHKDAMGIVLYSQTTYYIRDASGNIMATYMLSHDTMSWLTASIYGSSRLGEYHANKIVDIAGSNPSNPLASDEFEFNRGYKRYEMSNHLGNVLVVVSDKRTLICVGGNSYYEADIVSAQDYYPFGMLMKERTFSSASYSWGFNGMQKDDEISGSGNNLDFGARIYDSRLGRWLSVDPMFKKYQDYSTYNFSVNNPICFKDVDGEDVIDGAMFISHNKKTNINLWHASYFYFTRSSTAMSFVKNFSNGNDSKLLGIQNGDHKAGKWSHHTLEIKYYPDRDAATERGWTSLLIKTNDGSFKSLSQIKPNDLEGIEPNDLQIKTILWVEYSRRNTGSGAQVLAHEAFVHAESMVKEAEKIRLEKDVTPEQIIKRMTEINSFNNSKDEKAPHHQFKISNNATYENWLKDIKVVIKDKKEILKDILQSDKDDKSNQK